MDEGALIAYLEKIDSDVDPFRCPACVKTMSVTAVIRDPVEIRGITACPATRTQPVAAYRVACQAR